MFRRVSKNIGKVVDAIVEMIGQPSGIAPLDENSQIPAEHLPPLARVEINAETEFTHTHNLGRMVEVEVYKTIGSTNQKSFSVDISKDENSFTVRTLLPFTGFAEYR